MQVGLVGKDGKGVDILGHSMVPRHEIMTKGEAEELLGKFKITGDELPKILSSDAVVKRINAAVGSIIRITRDSPTAGKTVYYRIVAEK